MTKYQHVSYFLVLVFTLAKIQQLQCHPICLDDSDPEHRSGSEEFKLCKQFENYGCCDAEQESRIYERYIAMISGGASSNCIDMLIEVLCQECSPLAGHIYLTKYYNQHHSPHGLFPGLCPGYCSEFYETCFAILPFQLSSEEEFCKDMEAEDDYYCYPFVKSYGQREEQRITPGCLTMCFEEVANHLYQPIAAKSPNDGTNRFFVLEHRGIIWIYLANMSKISDPPFLNISDKIAVHLEKYDERGLLDFAFHPNFRENRLFYVYYCFLVKRVLYTRISQFKVSDNDMNVADESSEKIIMDIYQDTRRHNGGSLLFGTDGYLYASIGDGGILEETRNRGQDLSTILGKILRINVDVSEDSEQPYTIPQDNPYCSNSSFGARPEIYASGLRNAWRCTIDRGDSLTGQSKGRIFCGDVGSSKFEEVDLIEKGKNYGWRVMEGFHCSPKSPPGECTEESVVNYTLPLVEYPHRVMDCIIGGYVYRGCQNPAMQGLYISSGLRRGGLRGIKEDSEGKWVKQDMCMQKENICANKGLTNKIPFNIMSFAEDSDGELYILSTSTPGPGYIGGRIFKLVHVPNIQLKSGISGGACLPSKPFTKTVLSPEVKIKDYEPIPNLQSRLISGGVEQKTEGRLEIRLEDGEWGTVCRRKISPKVAQIGCIMATNKIGKASVTNNATMHGKGQGNIWLANLNCVGHEENLLDCYHNGWGKAGNCTHDEDVTLQCGRKKT